MSTQIDSRSTSATASADSTSSRTATENDEMKQSSASSTSTSKSMVNVVLDTLANNISITPEEQAEIAYQISNNKTDKQHLHSLISLLQSIEQQTKQLTDLHFTVYFANNMQQGDPVSVYVVLRNESDEYEFRSNEQGISAYELINAEFLIVATNKPLSIDEKEYKIVTNVRIDATVDQNTNSIHLGFHHAHDGFHYYTIHDGYQVHECNYLNDTESMTIKKK